VGYGNTKLFRVTLLCLPHGVPTNPTVRGVWEHQLFVVFVETATVSLDLILVFCVCLCLCLWLCLRKNTASVRVCVCVSVSQYMFESQPVSDPMSGVENLGFRGQAHARPGKWKGRSDWRQ